MTKLIQTKYRFGILVEFTHNMAGQTEFENSTGNTIHNCPVILAYFLGWVYLILGEPTQF